jgi:predicted secreted hydrolase
MYAQVRTAEALSYSFGSLIDAAGNLTPLDSADVTLTVLETWRSPASGAVYPARWQLAIDSLDLSLELTPLLANQEMPLAVVYWEGAVQIRGSQAGQPLSGYGFVELTGYAGGAQGRY